MFSLYLKSIEIQGFKSFPEKTRLTFDKPITGIVGPNGSGKSNISDALLWVMGEQSTKSLRGGKMEDVIFGGTQRRAQVGFAEVSLILDNSQGMLGIETTEVMITRRYYRSGESEYYINRANVRLKDVNELLMDTGLGREGYSIIGQGKIGEILSTKSKDRRAIFEEASGISRFRYKKEESERKLKQTDENLLRIGDKISELEMQVEPLREQAETARKYLLLRDELRGLEISVWLRELDTLAARAEKAEADHATAKIALEVTSREFNDCFADAEKLSEEMRQCDIDADAVRELISSAESRLADVESEIAVLKSQIESNIGQIDRINEELQGENDRSDGVEQQIADRESRLAEIADNRKSLDAESSKLVDELQSIASSSGASSEKLGALLKEDNELQSALNDSKVELSALASQAQEFYDMENSVKQEHHAAKEALSTQTDEHKISAEELRKAREDITSLNNIVNGLTLKAENRAKKAEASGEKLDKQSFELKTLESRRNLLQEMEKDYQGYSKSVKIIMQEFGRGSLKGIHGTVADLIKTSDRYTAAIETALGGAMQNIVVNNVDEGKAAINLLKRRDGGRATFLPISTIKGTVLNESNVGGDQGFEGVALNLIKFEPEYANIFANLLGRVVIADNLNSAARIAQKHDYKFRIVTLDGQVINAGGSMTGGSAASSAGILSRANELEQHKIRIAAIANDLTKLEREHSELVREKNAAQYELDVASAELRTAEDALIRLESDELHRSQLLEAAKEAILAFEEELNTLNSKIKQNSDETDSLKKLITGHESSIFSLKEQIEAAMQGQEKLSAERDHVNEEISELRSKIASLDAEAEAVVKYIAGLSALRDEMYGSRERQMSAIGDLKTKNEDIRAVIVSKERVAASFRKQIDTQKIKLTELNEKKLDIEAKRTTLNKTSLSKNQEMLDLERECSRLEQRKLTAQMEEKQILDKLWDNYELSRTAAASAGTQITNVSETQKRISALKKEITGLGTPNIGAIEEFERVNTRYTFLTEQRDDVEKAKSELIVIIEEITNKMRDIFLREFEIINISFEKTFKELFGGGRASLILEDPADVLECGVEIQVQPPGKSLKTITLLSGGEKAFVAIAIYFAILTVRPPPFVVMDEIDAALDDANVLRFASYMRKMSNTTQMVVISHKRPTMEESDVLYGVTMQELGVSNILSIDLSEADKLMAG